MSIFGTTEKEEFLNILKYPECGHCTSTMFCKFGCGNPEYPQGLADYRHPKWEPIIREYIRFYEANNIKSDSLAEHVRRAKLELASRDNGNT